MSKHPNQIEKKDGYIHIILSDGRKNANGKWYACFEGTVYAIAGDTAGEAVENLLTKSKDESFMKEISNFETLKT